MDKDEQVLVLLAQVARRQEVMIDFMRAAGIAKTLKRKRRGNDRWVEVEFEP